MSTRNAIAGLLTGIGIFGLAIAPFIVPTAPLRTDAGADKIDLAISLGSQLRLEALGNERAPETPATASVRNMVCENVYRLPVADIGLSCHTATTTKAVALVN